MILQLNNDAIKSTFLDLWNKKGCELPFTQKEFAFWCDCDMPESTTAYVVLDDEGSIVGGFIVYPLTLPPTLFVQLAIILNPHCRLEFKPFLQRVAEKHGFDSISFITPLGIRAHMGRIFEAEEVGVMLRHTWKPCKSKN